MQYTRKLLIEICQKAFVDESKWTDRDCAKAQLGVGMALALLKANCEFKVVTDEDPEDAHDSLNCVTDDQTIWIQFFVRDFFHFEYKNRGEKGNGSPEYFFYLPTMKRIKEAKGGDWY